MIVTKGVYYSILAIIAIVIAVIATLVALFLFKVDLSLDDERALANITRMHASSQIYQSRLEFYTGVCSDIGAKSPYNCNETNDTFAVEIARPDGGFYCADSTGFVGATNSSIGIATRCSIAE